MNNEAVNNLLKEMEMLGGKRINADVFGRSKSFSEIVKNQECLMTYPNEDDPAVMEYWRKRGLTKELHGLESGNIYDKWASYLPNEVADGNAENTLYPLLFVMHGAGNPIYLAESYGYTRIAARERMIVIIPEDETPDNIDKLFNYARENYPVDWTRVYMVGYSLGGFMTSRHAFRWPDRFAAVGVGGMLFANGWAIPHTQGGKVWEGEHITPEMVDIASKYRIPACICMGEYEMLGLLPVTQDEPINEWVEHLSEVERARAAEAPVHREHIDLSGKNKIQSINNWRIANGCDPIAEETVRKQASETANIVVEKIGFPFENTSVITREDRSFFVGDSADADGEVYFRVIGCAKSPHWPSQALTELTWEFISQFSLDPKTGMSYRRNS